MEVTKFNQFTFYRKDNIITIEECIGQSCFAVESVMSITQVFEDIYIKLMGGGVISLHVEFNPKTKDRRDSKFLEEIEEHKKECELVLEHCKTFINKGA